MDELQILIFRWGIEEYGISVEDVGGVIKKTWGGSRMVAAEINGGEKPQGTTIPILGSLIGSDDVYDKHAILMHCNGVHIALIVDEVIRVTGLDHGKQAAGASVGTFRIWHVR